MSLLMMPNLIEFGEDGNQKWVHLMARSCLGTLPGNALRAFTYIIEYSVMYIIMEHSIYMIETDSSVSSLNQGLYWGSTVTF